MKDKARKLRDMQVGMFHTLENREQAENAMKDMNSEQTVAFMMGLNYALEMAAKIVERGE